MLGLVQRRVELRRAARHGHCRAAALRRRGHGRCATARGGAEGIETRWASHGSIEILKKIQQGGSEVASTSWAFSVMLLLEEPFMGSMANRAIHLSNDFEAQGLSNLAWAAAKLRFHHPELMEILGDPFAEAASKHLPLFSALAPVAKATLPKAKIIEGTQLFWAVATVEYQDEDLLQSLSRWSLEHLHHFAPQQLAGVAWACGKTNTGSPVIDAIASLAASGSISSTPQQLAITAWAAATLRRKQQPFFAMVAEEVLSLQDELSTQDVANLAWSPATAASAPKPCTAALSAAAQRLVEEMEPQHLANRL
eukprot:s1625_g7.t1